MLRCVMSCMSAAGKPPNDGGDRVSSKIRCSWAGDDPMMIAYHDEEWGVLVHDDRLLFEFLVLEGAAGRFELVQQS